MPLGLERLAALGQRPHPSHHRPQPAGVDPAAELGQPRAVGLDNEEQPAGVGTGRTGRRAADHGDQRAAGPDQRPGPAGKVAADQVQDQVDLARGLLEPLAVDVDDPVGAGRA